MPSKLWRAIGAVKDQTSISFAKIVNTNSSNLDAAVLKATTRDPEPVNECYVNEILLAISSSKLHAAICVNAIAKRISKTTNWVVALKSLMLVLRIFQEGDPFFPQEVLHARNRGAKILNLTTFKDYSHSSPYDYTAFVRSFAFYLDQRLDCFITGKLQRRFTKEEKQTTSRGSSRRVNQQHVSEMKPPMLIDRISYWQRLLDRAIATKPAGAAKNHRLVQVSLHAIVRESFDLYRDISDGLGLLLDGFFHLPHQSCINAFEYCVKATKQFEQLSSFYDYCKDLGIGKNSEYPSVQMISEELMETLQEFLKDQASFLSRDSPCLLLAPAHQDGDHLEESQSRHGSKCISLEDLINCETDFDETMNPSFSPAHFSEFAEEQCHDQEDIYDVHETGSNHSLPIDKETSVNIDFVSFDDWLTSDNKSQEQQSSAVTNSSNGENDCLEFALVEATPQPTQPNGIDPSMAIDLYDQRPIVPQRTCNPFVEDGTDHEFSIEPTFKATPPTLFVQGPNETVRPTFQSTPTLSKDPNGTTATATTTMFEEKVYDPFAPWPITEANNNASFNGTDDEQNLILQQEMWLQSQNKIMARHIVSSNLE